MIIGSIFNVPEYLTCKKITIILEKKLYDLFENIIDEKVKVNKNLEPFIKPILSEIITTEEVNVHYDIGIDHDFDPSALMEYHYIRILIKTCREVKYHKKFYDIRLSIKHDYLIDNLNIDKKITWNFGLL